MAAGYLAIGSCMSAITRNQVVAFILAAVAILLFILSGFPMVLDFFSVWAPKVLIKTIATFSFLTHFDAISKGVIEVRDLVYFLSLTGFWLFATIVIVEMKKS